VLHRIDKLAIKKIFMLLFLKNDVIFKNNSTRG
jgi:hypothetical protein